MAHRYAARGTEKLLRAASAHPDLSLRDLGQLAEPPLSKSALYHRVLRLEKLLGEHETGA